MKLSPWWLAAVLVAASGCSQDTPLTSGAQASAPATVVRVASVAPASARTGARIADLPDRGALLAYGPAAVEHQGAYTWHAASISEEHALHAIGAEPLVVETPSGDRLSFRYQRHVEHPSGDWTWVGAPEGGAPGEQTIITFGPKATFGSIAQPGKPPLRLTVRNGVAYIVETDPTKLAAMPGALTEPKHPDFVVPPKLTRDTRTASGAPRAANAVAESAVPAGAPVVDLVLGYSSGFAAGLGGQSQAVTRLNYLVDVANQAYVNSQVVAEVRLVGTLEVAYPDNTDNSTALEEMTGFKAPSTKTTPAAAFLPLRAARDTYGADLVSFVRKFTTPENAGCGIAWLIGGDQSGISAQDESFGYSVVSDGVDQDVDGKSYFCRDETLAHEMGHNEGSAHDRATATKDGVVGYGIFPYSFGYKTDLLTGNFYTIMAYGDSGQTRYRTFSNPASTFCGGFPCGVADQADNARSLRQTLPIVATFRATVVAPPVPTSRVVVSDVDGDGRSDLLLNNVGLGQQANWTMNGAIPQRYSPAFSEPAGYRRVAEGDFNGDRLLDLVWARDSDRSLLMWLGTGTGFNQALVNGYSAGWQVIGAGDADGDGRSDLLLANAEQRQFAYWVMSGATVQRYSPAFSQPAAYHYVDSGDFNGDGKLDVLWNRPSDRMLLLWQGDGSGFAALAVRTYNKGWQPIAAADMDGDGRADVVLRNPGAATLAYWVMSGATTLRFSPAFTQPAGYVLAAMGDYNGDGRGDVVWARLVDRHLLMWLGDGSGFATQEIRYYSAGWTVTGENRPDPYVRGDADGDGKGDLLVENAATAQTAYWVMNGAAPVRYSPAFTQPAGAQRVATGDFNGDGNLDIVWSRTSDRALLLWLGDGAGFFQSSLPTPTPGWSVVAAGDVDGDGCSDLVLANAGTGQVADWLMRGATVLGYSPAFTRPADTQLVATGDFNGDGKLDLMWSRASDRMLLLWQGDGATFVQFAVRAASAGWTVRGAGDIDGDGRSDLLLVNAPEGLVAYWIMAGATPTRYSSAMAQPSQFVLASFMDHDGDRKLDLDWFRATDRAVLAWLGNGTGFTAASVGNASAGWAPTMP